MGRQRTPSSDEKTMCSIGIFIADPGLKQKGKNLALQTGLPVVREQALCTTALVLSRKGLLLARPNDHKMTGTVQVDFTTGAWLRRLKRAREERLVKAMGRHKQQPARIIDTTGGLGRDSFLLAAAGFQVQIFERNQILAALLADGLSRASKKAVTREICQRILFTPVNAINVFKSGDAVAEIVYLDPMFPQKNSMAKVKKELQMIQHVAGDDQDTGELFARALQVAINRVVVKRPKKGPWLDDIRPDYSLTGKTIRFDIYLTSGGPTTL